MVMAFSLSKIGFRSAAILGEQKAKCQVLFYSTTPPAKPAIPFLPRLLNLAKYCDSGFYGVRRLDAAFPSSAISCDGSSAP
jgi:hypothetical protein